MRSSKILANLCRLVNEGAIGYDDLDGFSEKLREDVIRITSYNAHGSEKFGGNCDEDKTTDGGDIPMETLNEYLYSYIKTPPSEKTSKLNIANSVWFRDNGFTAEKTFLQKNADYYGAAAYKSPFDGKTLRDINNRVKKNTDGKIEKIIDSIDSDAVMYLINTVLFDAEWENIYKKDEVGDGAFTAIDSTKKTVPMMYSEEHSYLDDGKATGFIRPYKNGYGFAALLPNEDISLSDYAASVTGKSFIDTIKKPMISRLKRRYRSFLTIMTLK